MTHLEEIKFKRSARQSESVRGRGYRFMVCPKEDSECMFVNGTGDLLIIRKVDSPISTQ